MENERNNLVPPMAESEQEERRKNLTSKYNETVATLLEETDWSFVHLHNFNGFWVPQSRVKDVVFIQDHTFWHKPPDIILATSLKCGTTWLKALTFAIVHRDSIHSASHPLLTTNPHDLVPFLEMFIAQDDSISLLESMPSPRIFSTHVPHSLLSAPGLSSESRVVYLCRDPKDVLVSTWSFFNSMERKPEGTPLISLQETFELFCDGVSLYGPFWDHVLEYWKASLETPERVLFLKYEDMKKAPLVHVKRLAEFLGKPFSSEEESQGVAEEIVRLCSFKNLSNLEVNKSEFSSNCKIKNSHYFRRGEVGDWENHLTPEMAARLDEITKEKLHPFGLSFT